jgi:N-acetylcysteine deacetylase
MTIERNKQFSLHTIQIQRLIATRRAIHRNPELSFAEFETHELICRRLSELNIPYRSCATTGVVAHIGSGDSCIALRADIDALPITEETGLEFASATPGAMHACGHDMHTSMLLMACELLQERKDELRGVVKVLFQPGEEKAPGGASLMIADGALANPTPSYVFGQHVNPAAEVGSVQYAHGAMMAAADELYITVTGHGAHAAQPHLGSDPILAASELIIHLQTLLTKRKNPLDNAVLTITSFNGGSATNIIPETVELKGTLRTFNPTFRDEALRFLRERVTTFCSLHGCTAVLTVVEGYPPLVNDSAATAIVAKAANAVTNNNVQVFEPKMWAEDFAFYTERVPSSFWMVGCAPKGITLHAGLHNAKFTPDEAAMITGTEMLVAVALEALENIHRNSPQEATIAPQQ